MCDVGRIVFINDVSYLSITKQALGYFTHWLLNLDTAPSPADAEAVGIGASSIMGNLHQGSSNIADSLKHA